MLLALLFLASCLYFGWVVACRLAALDDWHKRSAFAIGFGVLIGAWLALVLSWAAGRLSELTIITSSAVMLAASSLLANKYRKTPTVPSDRTGIVVVAIIIAVLMLVNSAVVMRANEWGEITGSEGTWWDVPFHLSVITSFTERANFPPQHPYLLGAPLAYPFLADFLSAIMVKGGFDLRSSILFPHLLFYFSLASFAYFIGKKITKSKGAATIAVILFLFNGNAAIVEFGKAAMQAPGFSVFLQHLPYPKMEGQGLYFHNMVFAVFVGQRAAIMGFALSLVFYYLLLEYLEKKNMKTLLSSGVILGLMPLVHTHSFLAASIAASFWGIYAIAKSKNKTEEIKRLFFFAAPALLFALPQLAWLTQHPQLGTKFFSLQYGWLDKNKGMGLLQLSLFWLANAWVAIPLAVIGLLLAPKNAVKFYAPFLALFILGNTVKLQPWDWDNIKLFIHWFFFTAVFAAIPIAMLWNSRRKILKATAIGILLLATASGWLTLWWWANDSHGIYDRQEVAAAEWIKANTDPEAVWMTSDAQDNLVQQLAGRKIIAGQFVLALSHGLNVKQQLQDADKFFQHADCEVARKYNASYAFVGPAEDSLKKADRAAFRNNPAFEKISELPIGRTTAEIYRIRC